MTSIPGVDYAWSHPGGAALKAAGKQFVCRYLSPDSSKNIARIEADDLAAHGIWSVVVWESTAARAKAGKAAGVADAKTAAIQAAAAGMPGSRPIYFAVDFDATEADQAYINAYLDGAASVIGRGRVGIYGGYYPVKRALDGGHASWAWQTIAWSGGQWDPRAVIRQGAQMTINGVSCDLNTATAADYGQWMPGKTPTVEETPMAVTDADALKIARRVLTLDEITAPADAPDAKTNPSWRLDSYTKDTNARVRSLEKQLTALAKTNATLVTTVATLAANVGDLDPQAVVDKLTQAIESIDVHLDVSSAPAAP
jgi:hypothetical protein